MDRFTKLANGKTCCTHFGWSEECKRVQGHCCECKINDMAWDTLRGYEDAEEDGFLQIMDCMGCKNYDGNYNKPLCFNCVRNNKMDDYYVSSEAFDKFINDILNEIE